MFSKAPAAPAYSRLYQEISSMIASGRWKEGEKLPTEKELSSSFGVSVGTVRKAMDLLEQDGFCRREQGRGTFASAPMESAPVFYRMRSSLYGKDMRIASPDVARSPAPLPEEAAQALKLETGTPGIRILRRLQCGAEPSPSPLGISESWFPADLCAALLDTPERDFSRLSLYHILKRDCPAPVLFCDELIRICEKPPFSDAESEEIFQGKPCFQLTMTAFTYGKQPLEYRTSFIAAGSIGLLRRHDLRQAYSSTV